MAGTNGLDKLGKMYTVKERYWYVFPDKHMAMVAPAPYDSYESTFDKNTIYLKPNDMVVLLEEYKFCKKLLLPNGQIGWIVYHYWCYPYFEEM